jgi:hypothetical protein
MDSAFGVRPEKKSRDIPFFKVYNEETGRLNSEQSHLFILGMHNHSSEKKQSLQNSLT